MLERITGKLFQRLLADYFEPSTESAPIRASIWSGFVRYDDLTVKIDKLNHKLADDGLPFRLVHGHVRSLQITVPWSKLSSPRRGSQLTDRHDPVVVVVDGLSLLLTTAYEYDDDRLRQRHARKRRQQLATATDKVHAVEETVTWKQLLETKLKEGLLPSLVERLEIHLRDVHVRLEDLTTDPAHPFAVGMVLESMHIQKDEQASELIRKMAHLNHFGVYWNALQSNEDDPIVIVESRILQFLSRAERTAILDQTIARRTTTESPATAPLHTYLLMPVDATLKAVLATPVQQATVKPPPPALALTIDVPQVHVQYRDFQCLQLLRFKHFVKEHLYRRRYRLYRPSVSVAENPQAWWRYAFDVIQLELRQYRLRWSLARFQKQFENRQRYCDFYRRKLLAEMNGPSPPDDAAGPELRPLTAEETKEMHAMEDGLEGHLSVLDIVLYRILVNKRIGVQALNASRHPAKTPSPRGSWFRRTISSMTGDDEQFEEDYQRLISYWQEWSEQEARGNRFEESSEPHGSSAAVLIELTVDRGHVSLFSPLESTADQLSYTRRLQQRFLDLTYTRFSVGVSLMRDFESLSVNASLLDFSATETRVDQNTYSVIAREVEAEPRNAVVVNGNHDRETARPPLLAVLFTKNPPSTNDFHIGLQVRVYGLELLLEPTCEWVPRIKGLIQPIPQFQEISKVWDDFSVELVEQWASRRLGLLARANAAAVEHKNIDFDIEVDCPIMRVVGGDGSFFVLDLGRARFRTDKLAGVAEALMFSSSAKLDRSFSANDRDEVSVMTPPKWQLPSGRSRRLSSLSGRSRGPPLDSDGFDAGTGSVQLGASMRLDDAVFETLEDDEDDTELDGFFYDVFELSFAPGGLAFESPGKDSETIIAEMSIHVMISKSVIPADHSISRLKVKSALEDISVTLTEEQIVSCLNIWTSWAVALSSDAYLSPLSFEAISSREKMFLEMHATTNYGATDEASEGSSTFDENEFFDAAENDSHISEHDASTILDEHWIADSESVVESEARSTGRAGRRRRRRRSLSDVSSVSDTSTSKRKFQLPDGLYLNAENLARLEEGVDESVGEDATESDGASFRSAVSPAHLLILANDLEDSIQRAETNLAAIRAQLAAFRRVSESVASSDAMSRDRAKKSLVLDLQRAEFELKALKAAHCDTLAQKETVDADGRSVSSADATRKHGSVSVRRASTLLQHHRQRTTDATVIGNELNAAKKSKRELFRGSFLVRRVSLCFHQAAAFEAAQQASDCHVTVSHVGLVYRKAVCESKLFASVEHLNVSTRLVYATGSHQIPLLLGGVDYRATNATLPSRLPQLVSSSTMEEKLLRCAIVLRKGMHYHGRPSKHAKVRVSFGDVEITPRSAMLKPLVEAVERVRGKVSDTVVKGDSGRRRPIVESQERPIAHAAYTDVLLRLASVRLCVHDGREAVGAMAVTELGIHVVHASAQQIYKDRCQIQARCQNLQLLSIESLDTGQGFEMAGRKDLFSPVLKMRLKSQRVLQDDAGGWVTGDLSEGTVFGDEATISVWNEYVEVRLEGLTVALVPASLLRFQSALLSLNEARLEKRPKTANEVQVPRRLVRFRSDVGVGRSSVAFLARPMRDERVQQTSRQPVVSFAASASLQHSARCRGSIALSASLQEFYVRRMPDDRPIVEPASLVLELECPCKLPFDAPFRFVQLFLRDDARGQSSDPSNECGPNGNGHTTRKALGNDALSVSFYGELSPVRVNFSPPTIGLLVERAALFSKLHERVKSTQADVNVSEREGTRVNRNLSFSLHVDGVLVSLDREPVAGPNKVAARLLSLWLEAIELSWTSATSEQFTASVAYGSVVDFSSRSGVRMLSGGLRTEPRQELLQLAFNTSEFSKRRRLYCDLIVAKIQFIPLPSCIASAISFLRETKDLQRKGEEGTAADSRPSGRSSSLQERLRSIQNVAFSVRMESFECILSSRDVAKYIRDAVCEPIGVVAFRLNVKARGLVRVSLLDEPSGLGDLVYTREDRSLVIQDALASFAASHADKGCTAFTSEVEVNVADFQVLRTTIERSEASPVAFDISPPAAGEQRITNSFQFSMTHHAACLLMLTDKGSKDWAIGGSHALQIKAELVDILVYVAQSTGGMSEALQSTVLPIVEIMKNDQKEKVAASSSNADFAKSDQDVKGVLSSCPFVCAIRAEGFKVTCVPGGATRLTESPLAKFVLRDISCGVATNALDSDGSFSSGARLEEMALASFVSTMHIFAGGWLTCEVSASYNNRRIVAWEPFIEPWRFEALLGSNLSRSIGLSPLLVSRRTTQVVASDSARYGTSAVDLGGGRLRDIGRLLRSPFKGDRSSERDPNEDSQAAVRTEMDFCYLVLLSISSKALTAASFPLLSSGAPPSLWLLPSERPIRWLSRFGYPPDADPDSKPVSGQPAVMCRISDSVPLNINFTGALIENLSKYLGKRGETEESRHLAPHRIRNESGLTLRFQEVLDRERQLKGDKSTRVTLASGNEAPLSLRRSLSQSCDPHMAYIVIELGSFEDTVGRVKKMSALKGSRSSAFSYKVAAKIPVDAVGLHRYPLDSNIDRRPGQVTESGPLGWVIVRVALRGGVKMVTIESPLVLQNTSDVDLLCEVRDQQAMSLLWRCLVPRSSEMCDGCLPVPLDIIPYIQSNNCRLAALALARTTLMRHESEMPQVEEKLFCRLSPPRPYSRSSLAKGLIAIKNESLSEVMTGPLAGEIGRVHLSVCSIRIGSFNLDQPTRTQSTDRSQSFVPEQRLMMFRSPLLIENHLAVPVFIQIRLRDQRGSPHVFERTDQSSSDTLVPLEQKKWLNLGRLDCGERISWTGAPTTEALEFRIRLERSVGAFARDFPDWSTPSTIYPDESYPSLPKAASRATQTRRLQDVRVIDTSNAPFLVSVTLTKGGIAADLATACDSAKQFANAVPSASRIVSLFVPYWIVDSTGLDLQYRSGSFIAGESRSQNGLTVDGKGSSGHSLGLGELLDENDFAYLPSRRAFEVLMVGNEGSKHLQVRRRQRRRHDLGHELSPWSDPMPLTSEHNSYYDTTVLPPTIGAQDLADFSLRDEAPTEPFALRTHVIRAPDSCGGLLGTKVIHVACRYEVLNELGRDIEILGGSDETRRTVIKAGTQPVAFHFDDSSPVRFRPKEFGWIWSGRVHLKRSRGEVVLQLKHKLKRLSIIVSVDFHSKKGSRSCTIAFREAAHAPYRIENHSNCPIQYNQVVSMVDLERVTGHTPSFSDAIILPYHSAEFAWDAPESRRRSISIRVADLGDTVALEANRSLGKLNIDRMTPGTAVPLARRGLVGMVLADGPTRVFRVLESQQVRIADVKDVGSSKSPSKPTSAAWLVTVKLSHGIGVSVVDWSPQELLYFRLDDLIVEQVADNLKAAGSVSIGCITIDNQLWVTPYPVMLKMGSRQTRRRRNRRKCAVALNWCRRRSSDVGYSDLSLYENLDLSTEPIMINVDGNLAELLIRMVRQVKEMGPVSRQVSSSLPRNEALRMELDVDEQIDTDEMLDAQKGLAGALYSAIDYVATVGNAAKLRTRYLPPKQTVASSRDPQGAIMKRPHKYYIERLRISTTAAEVSWSGTLPVASSLPRLLRPALTFEGLPVFLRPFSSTHVYGSTDEHFQLIKSHYFSFWRIFDLCVGVLTKPSFLVRACVYTTRETFATAFDAFAGSLRGCESGLVQVVSRIPPESSFTTSLANAIVQTVVAFNAAILAGLAEFASAGSSVLQYSASRYRAGGTMVRVRNPRLFANVDGKELLVEYVAGQNAGKALLSRVRMGAHLGEGYVFHIEDTHLSTPKPRRKLETDMDTRNCVLMLTNERILLLNGQLNALFCDVIWETPLADVVHIESRDIAEGPAHIIVLIWFLADSRPTNREERHARALVTDSGGLEALHCKQVFVPKVHIPSLLEKIKLINRRLVDLVSSQ